MNHETLLKFCLQDGTSATTKNGTFVMNEPFVVGEWKYATNGQMCVRVPADELRTRQGTGKFPGAEELFADGVKGSWAPWPGRLYCPTCCDAGEVFNEYSFEPRPCPTCDGRGPSGQLVDVTGYTPSGMRAIAVGRHLIGVDFDDLLRSLPSLSYADGYPDPKSPLPFKFDGGEGRVMGIGLKTATANTADEKP